MRRRCWNRVVRLNAADKKSETYGAQWGERGVQEGQTPIGGCSPHSEPPWTIPPPFPGEKAAGWTIIGFQIRPPDTSPPPLTICP